jgi:NitT/TauT family transport system substrate-binding protein
MHDSLPASSDEANGGEKSAVNFDMGPAFPGLTRRRLLASAASGAAFAAIGPARARGNTEIRVQYDWLIGNGQIGDIVAQQSGYFDAEKLTVTFGAGGPNAQTVPAVLSGQALGGQLSTSTQALNAYGAGRPVKVFCFGYQYAPYAYFSLPRSPIRTPQDLVGKTVALNPNGHFMLDLILALHKIDPARVRRVTMGADMTPLLAGQVDAVTGFTTNTAALAVLGPDRVAMTSEQAGVPTYANAYFTFADDYQKNKDVLVRFIRAVAKGWAWAYQNRKAAVDMMCDAYPNLDRAIEHASVDVVMAIVFNEATKENGWGWFDNARIERQIELFKQAGSFTTRVPDLDGFATHEILDLTADARAKLG